MPRLPGSGRKSARTPENRAVYLKAIEIGGSFNSAASAVGFHINTMREWRNDDPEFAEAVDVARGLWQQKQIERISAQGDRDWRALAFLLERVAPDEFGQRRAVELSGKDGSPVQVEAVSLAQRLDSLGLDELRAIASQTKSVQSVLQSVQPEDSANDT